MKRIGDDKFLEMKPNPDTVVGIRVKDGEFYFLAWMEDAPHYRIQQAVDYEKCMLNREYLIFDGDLLTAISCTDGYNNMYFLYELDDDGNLINDDDKEFENEYEKFLTLIKCYERNGASDPEDHDILMLTKEELSQFCDILRDGDYILIVEDLV